MKLKKILILIVTNLIIMSILSTAVGSNFEHAEEGMEENEILSMNPNTFGAPIGITNAAQLQNMQNNLSGNYFIAADFDCSDTKSWNGGAGFIPVGNESAPFNGTLDGRGYKITGLYINRSEENFTGLFGHITTGAVIKNVNLIDIYVNGLNRAGGLAGFNNNSIVHNCTVTGIINSSSYAGGLVGENTGTITNCTSIINITASSGSYIGGLVGDNFGSISECSSEINLTADSYVGGLVGRNNQNGKLQNCYSTGIITGNNWVGGLIGYNDKGIISDSNVDVFLNNTSRFVGGLVGGNYNGTIVGCNAEGTIIADDSEVGGLVGINYGTIANCTTSSTIDAQNEINIGGLVGNNQGNITNCSAKTSDLKGQGNVGGFVGLNNGSIYDSYSKSTIDASGDWIGGFVGNNSKFGQIENGSSSGSVTGNDFVGGFIGYNHNSTIKNTYTTSSVEGNLGVGGHTGKNYGIINNSYSTGSVTGASLKGGFVGVNINATQYCFFDNITSGMTQSVGAGNISNLTGKNTTDMMTQFTFTNASWDFVNVWDIIEDQTYPYLRSVYQKPRIETNTLPAAVEDESYSFQIESFVSSQPYGNQLAWNYATNTGSWLAKGPGNSLSGMPTNDDVGTYWLKVTVTDLLNNIESRNFSLVVENTNDKPNITTANDETGKEDEFYSVDYDATDIDPGPDVLSWSITTNFTSGWLQINKTSGVLNGTPRNEDVGTWWVNVTVDDNAGGLAHKNFTITIDNVNDDPEITTLSFSKNAYEDELYIVNFDALDPDPTNDVLTWSRQSDAKWLSINSTSGLLMGTPTNEQSNRSYWVNVTVKDDKTGIAWINYTLWVNNVNDAPKITTPNEVTATEDVLYSVDYDADDIDPTNDVFTWTLDSDASWLSIDADTGVLAGTPENMHVGNFSVNVSVEDDYFGSTYTLFTLTVQNTNDPPDITTGEVTTAKVDELYYVNYDANDIDPTEDKLEWDVDTNASWLSIDPDTGVLSGTPEFSDIGYYNVNVTVSDGRGGSDFNDFKLTVILINSGPNIITKDVTTATTGIKYFVQYNATDDRTPADKLVWTGNTNASWLSFDPGTKVLSGTPGEGDAGTYSVEITVSDGEGGVTKRNFVITVKKPVVITNHPPVLTNGKMTPGSGNTQTWFTFSVDYYDEDGDAPTSITVVIDGEAFEMSPVSGSASDGTYEYRTQLGEGEHSYYFTASDGSANANAGDATPTGTALAVTTPSISKVSEDKESEELNTAMVGVVIVIILIIVIILLLVIRKRRAEEEVEVLLECPECGVPIDRDETTCPECGVDIEREEEEEEEEEFECSECGALLSADDTVCPECGEEIEEEEE
ncbi:MAG: putative Ig domain-containing protein [Thermoplasmata archaeon]|nr:MAG: putative Ig domain-containing protein [Thermoplasmata archaeon]